MRPVYDAWNAALAQRFLQHRRGVPLYLYTDEAVLEELSGQVGVRASEALDRFVRDVRETLGSHEPFGPWARAAMRPVPQGEPPTFLGVLCFLVLVGVERDSTRFQYYPELNVHLRRPASGGAPPGFDLHVPLLFRKFNDWLGGEGAQHGLATARSHQHFPNVGWPLSQAIVRPVDRGLLARLFASERLEPGLTHTGAWLRGRLVRRLQTCAASESRTRLLDLNMHHGDLFEDVLVQEYAAWDGRASVVLGPRRVALRLCFDETRGEWWLQAPRVDGTQGRRWTLGSATGVVPSFKDLEIELPDVPLWRAVGAGDVGQIEDGPVLCSRAARTRWLSLDLRAGGWAEVPRRDAAVDQLLLVAAEDAARYLSVEGTVRREETPAGQVLLLVPGGSILDEADLPAREQRPRLQGGLRLSASTHTYLRVLTGLPNVLPVSDARLGECRLRVEDDVAFLDVLPPEGDHVLNADGHRLSLRLVDRLESGPSARHGRPSWSDDLPVVERVRVPWHAGSIWLVGERGELEERPPAPPPWLQELGLVVGELDVTSMLTSTGFAPAFVVARTYRGKPWVEAVPKTLARARDGERPRELNRSAARELVSALLVQYGPDDRAADPRWKRAFAAVLRAVHS